MGAEHPEAAVVYRAGAMCAFEAEKLDLARRFIEKSLKTLPPDYDPEFRSRCVSLQIAIDLDLARSHGHAVPEADINKAVDELKSAVCLRKDTSPIGITMIKLLSYLALAQALAGRWSDAKATADRAFQMAEPMCPNYKQHAVLAKAEVYALEGSPAEAERWYQKATEISMHWPEEHTFRQRVSRSRSRIPATARSGLLPANWVTWGCLGKWHLLPAQPEMLFLSSEHR
mmetsp:Transcript_13939/g.28946  ORF Transcript_13939/g.28946 Transcript_13939/m.28946 type:complete len:229 (+) Transcript_13939:54-740(+)|eukprot:s1308_g19.t1